MNLKEIESHEIWMRYLSVPGGGNTIIKIDPDFNEGEIRAAIRNFRRRVNVKNWNYWTVEDLIVCPYTGKVDWERHYNRHQIQVRGIGASPTERGYDLDVNEIYELVKF